VGFALVSIAVAAIGCTTLRESREKIPPGPTEVLDRDHPDESLNPLDAGALQQAAEQLRRARKPGNPPDRKYRVLVVSGGGIYGAFPAGVLTGWTEAGTRPTFDVVTGISTGALIAAVAFLGPADDPLLRELYTQVENKDIFVIRKPVRSIFSESIADSSPFEERMRCVVTPDKLRRVAAEHAKGRRLYVGTTNLATRRLVVWDMGAIAARGTPESEKLFEDVLLASSAVPGFFAPRRIDVDIDGRTVEELHVDGGVSRSMFFRPPYVPPGQREGFGPNSLYDSDLYVLVAGKLYADSDAVKPRALAIAGSAITSLLYSQARGDIDRLFNYAVLTGMNFRLGAIPQEFEMSNQALKFDRAEMTRIFEEGRRLGREQKFWNSQPPALDVTEELRARTGTRLTEVPGPGPKQQAAPPEAPGPTPDEGIPVPGVGPLVK
jgi:hypothetical protein